MKKMKGFQALVAVVLVLCMVMGCGTAALADVSINDTSVNLNGEPGNSEYSATDAVVGGVVVTDDRDPITEEISVKVQGINESNAVINYPGVYVKDNSDIVSITTNSDPAKDEGIKAENIFSNGVNVVENHGTLNIDTSEISSGSTSIYVYSNDGTINLNQNPDGNGNTQGTDLQNDYDGDSVFISKNNGSINLNINNMTGKNNGVEIYSNAKTIDIDANTVTGTGGDGIKIGDYTTNNISNKVGGTINLNVGDVEGNGNTNAIESGISVSGNAGTVNINQKTKTDQNNQTAGTSIYGSEFGIFILDNTGTINMKQEKGDTPGDITGGSTGILINNHNSNDGSISLTAGKITGGGGIIITNETLGKSSTVVNAESVTATYSGIDVYSEDKADITVKGKVSVVSDGYSSNGVITNNSGVTVKAGEVSVSAHADDDNLISISYGLEVEGGTVIIEENKGNKGATGNVKATDTGNGLAYGLDLYGDKESDVVVEGTLYGDTAAINLADNFEGNADVTVWKLETDKNGTLVSGDDANGTFAAAINYIVKLSEGLDKASVSTEKKKTLGYNENTVIHKTTDEVDDYKYHTAKENEVVTITLDDLDGFNADYGDTLDVWYNYDDKTAGKLEKGDTAANGIFSLAGKVISLLMNPGGGMMLNATVTKHTHDYKYKSTETAATCTTSGTDIYECSICHTTKQVTVAAKGHTEVADAAVAATCTTAGKTAGYHCSACNAVIKAQETVPAKGHSAAAAVKENEKAAKVGVAGSYDEVVYCKDCGAQISRKTVTVPALPEEEKEEKKQEEKQDDKQETAGTVKAAPVKAAMKDAPETPESRLVRELFENNADNVRSILPADILAQIPENVKRLIDTKTLKLVDYDESMGAMTFELVCGADFREDEEVWVVFVLPGEDTDRMFVVKGIGQADGTLLVTPSAEILKQLAGKTFMAAVLGE